ncbi:O-antigen ligase family protein [Oceanobacillus locisalsi]|uniref:O-antigen ligase family protein n=1 Tax=Oceanobacillus locisalsi TaxID=546107 RepID=A0ABW3NDP7_9BACI
MQKISKSNYEMYNIQNKSKGINFSELALLIFVFYIFTQGWLFYLIIQNNFIEITVLLVVTSILFFKSLINNFSVLTFTLLDALWVFSIAVILVLISMSGFKENDVLIFMYVFGLLFLLLAKTNINNFDTSFIVIKYAAIVYALSSIFHYFFTETYHSLIFPYIPSTAQQRVLELVNLDYFAGLGLSQPSLAAGPMIMGIGVTLAQLNSGEKQNKKWNIIIIILLIITLLIAGKRSVLIWGGISVVITQLLLASGKKKVLKILKYSSIGLILVGITYVFWEFLQSLPILSKVVESIQGIDSGEDVTNGRIVLYQRAWELFLENPIFGIGWGQFVEVTSGLLARDLVVHNVYLQLLSETGLIGFIIIIIPIIYGYILTIKCYKGIKNTTFISVKWKTGLVFSIYYQTFFLLYCFTENPFYNVVYLFMFFFCLAIVNSFIVLKIRKSEYYEV